MSEAQELMYPAGNVVRDGVIGILAFCIAAYILYINAPYRGVGEFLFVCVVCFILTGVSVVVISFVYPFAYKIILLILALPAWLYDYCDDKLNNVERKKGRTVRDNPKAKVGIKYFIEREKRLQINHAKWMDLP